MKYMTTKLHLKTARMQIIIKNGKSVILKENTLTQRFIASQLVISSETESEIIHKDLIFEEEIPTLHGKDIDKVELHLAKASSHTSKSNAVSLVKERIRNARADFFVRRKVARYTANMHKNTIQLESTGARYTPDFTVPVKSNDASPVDFCAFGLLQRASGKRHPRTLNGLLKTVQEK
ncbi:hypothetical protein TNCV_424901 [Trichonephila clavipes]|nr:hypothetical protein TNCV_424901 [Trichonephila clavipes]